MCVVSMIGDYWANTIPGKPGIIHTPGLPMTTTHITLAPQITREEFDQLKREIAELKELLLAGKKYDEAMGEPDCEMDAKVALIRQVAKLVGIDMSEVFGEANE